MDLRMARDLLALTMLEAEAVRPSRLLPEYQPQEVDLDLGKAREAWQQIERAQKETGGPVELGGFTFNIGAKL